jgi:GT2 family glycosyltransferase
MKKVSIITVNFNQPKVTEELLASLETDNDYSNVEVIVVDNGSRQNPVPDWVTAHPQHQFLRSEENLGFAGGNNLGIAQATGNFIFLVNNDTVFTKGLVHDLVNCLEANEKIGLVSPKILYWDEPTIVQYAGFTPMNFFLARNGVIGQGQEDLGQWKNVSQPTAYPHGAAMMCRRETMEKVGLMDPIFFLYYEELDWAEAFRRKGYEHWFCGSATIYHKESITVGKTSRLKELYMNRNRLFFIRRNASFLQASFFWFYFLLVVVPRNILSYIKQGNFTFISALFEAIGWNLRHPARRH